MTRSGKKDFRGGRRGRELVEEVGEKEREERREWRRERDRSNIESTGRGNGSPQSSVCICGGTGSGSICNAETLRACCDRIVVRLVLNLVVRVKFVKEFVNSEGKQ